MPSVCLLQITNSDLNDWLDLFTSLLQVAEKYEKILITGDFNFPDLIWDCDNAFQTLSSSSIQFRDLIQDFFLEQVSLFLTRSKNILDLIIQ
jgi:aminoglycoside/choline kinase family phosphotransferase